MNPITPAGHTHTITSKAYATETKSELEKAFEEWKGIENKKEAQHLFPPDLMPETLTVAELHSLVLQNRGSLDFWDGLFISAGYNRCDENAIIYDVDSPLDLLGCNLARDKLLVNCSTTGNYLGYQARGIILNIGRTGLFFGKLASGMIINAGRTDAKFGGIGLTIALTAPGRYAADAENNTLRHDKIPPSLKEYLEGLASVCAGPTTGVYTRYGETPSFHIKESIYNELHKIFEAEART